MAFNTPLNRALKTLDPDSGDPDKVVFAIKAACSECASKIVSIFSEAQHQTDVASSLLKELQLVNALIHLNTVSEMAISATKTGLPSSFSFPDDNRTNAFETPAFEQRASRRGGDDEDDDAMEFSNGGGGGGGGGSDVESRTRTTSSAETVPKIQNPDQYFQNLYRVGQSAAPGGYLPKPTANYDAW